MKIFFKRSLSLFLAIIMLTSILSSSFLFVFANAEERNASFINFYQDSDTTLLDMKNLSNQDYYAMFLFMSNWFEPGKTTLKEIYFPDSTVGNFFYNYSTAMSKTTGSGAEKLEKVVAGFGADILNGFISGECTLCDSSNKVITGEEFLGIIANTIQYTKKYDYTKARDMYTTTMNSTNSKVYFKDNKHLAFDFSEDVIRAAFQTVLAYNPDLFLTEGGISECDTLFLDAVGNVWGAKDNVIISKPGTVGSVSLSESDLGNIYLILPACLNPSAFTPKVSSQDELRMPLMNRFVLSSLVTGNGVGDSIQNFDTQYIPIYNLLANYNQSQVLTVIGLKTVSPYTFNTGKIKEDILWSDEQRQQDLASFLYNYKEVTIDLEESKDGIASIDTYAYIAFCMNLNYVGTKNDKVTDSKGISQHGELDLQNGMWFWKSEAFSVFNGNQEKQQKLLSYFFNPTILPFDKVSMNFYRYEDQGSATTLEDQFGDYFRGKEGTYASIDKVSEVGLASNEVSELGLAGMGLYIEDIAVYSHDNETYKKNISLTATGTKPSRLVSELSSLLQLKETYGLSSETSYDIYKKVSEGDVPSQTQYQFQKQLFLDDFVMDIDDLILTGHDVKLWTDRYYTDYDFHTGFEDAKINPEEHLLDYIYNGFIDVVDLALGTANFETGSYQFTSMYLKFKFNIFDAVVNLIAGDPIVNLSTYATFYSSLLYDSDKDGFIEENEPNAFRESIPFERKRIAEFNCLGEYGFLNYDFGRALDRCTIELFNVDISPLTDYINSPYQPESGYTLGDSDFNTVSSSKDTDVVDSEKSTEDETVYKQDDSVDAEGGQGQVWNPSEYNTKAPKYTLLDKYLNFDYTAIKDEILLYIGPSTDTVINVGNWTNDITLGSLLGLNDIDIRHEIAFRTNNLKDYEGLAITIDVEDMPEYILALYGYSVIYPAYGLDILPNARNTNVSLYTMGVAAPNNSVSSMRMGQLSQDYLMGMYLGYIVDMMGLGVGTDENASIRFGTFYSPFLPSYDISAKGGNMSISSMMNNSISGVDKTEDLSFEEKQKTLIDRIYGLTNDSNNDYRNSWIKNIIEGFFLTIHRTITGTWGSSINTITTGNNSTYQSVTGYIYTPTLEELSFTATLMNNYIKIYIICLMCVFFITILMVLLHMRTWQQGLITVMVMCVALLFPYILISNSISISNKISNTIYSDRFDFWAMTEHYRSMSQLVGTEFMTDKDLWLVEGSATTDTTLTGQPGVKIKWMSPKKVDMFQNLYSDPDLSESFVTNIEIFKWLFNSFIYDSEFVDTDVYGSFVYRSYNSIALEAKSYYQWGLALLDYKGINSDYRLDSYNSTRITNDVGNTLATYSIPSAYANTIDLLNYWGDGAVNSFLAGVGRFDSTYFTSSNSDLSNLMYAQKTYNDINLVSQYKVSDNIDKDADKIALWGIINEEITNVVIDQNALTNDINPGIFSNLPSSSSAEYEFEDDPEGASMAIYLKNTESPFYYFYSVLKMRYGNADMNGDTSFKKSLLYGDLFKVNSKESGDLESTNKNLTGAYRDYLDLEGLFSYIIPYMKFTNDYVKNWQSENYSEIEEYNFVYTPNEEGSVVDKDGNVLQGTIGVVEGENVLGDDNLGMNRNNYEQAVIRKNNLNRVWNMYCPWVESLYDLDILNARVSFGGKTKYLSDSLNPSSYHAIGRPMIFSEADMYIKGYSYKDLTDVERRIQAVLENTYKDMLYLVNYYDMDDEVLLVAAAMYATFNFNEEFSQNNLLSESVELYPQGFELKNFNYDAFMRLALLNATGENVFADDDLYARILSKTNIFTGLLLILCDLVACVIIPAFKFIMLIGLLFLGILVCVSCVVNPPDKIMKAVSESVLLPTALFMLLNIGFSWVMSFVVGEGLTTYVGSKGVNFATNDPTMTMLVMAALGIVYTIFAFKILKMLFKAYKKFGMTSVFATMGILSSAVTAGASKIMRKGSALLGAGAGAVVGAATAEKGNRLAGAFEGGSLGTRRVINQRIRDKRYREMMKHSGGSGGGTGVTSEIDAKAGGKSVDLGKKKSLDKASKPFGGVKSSSTTQDEMAKQDKGTPKKSETPTLDKPYKKSDDKKMNLYGRYLSNKEYRKKKAADALEIKKYKKETKETSLRRKRAEDALKKKEREKAAAKRRDDIKNAPKRIKQKWVDYKKEGEKQAREAGKSYEALNKERKAERRKQLSEEKAEIRKIERKAGIKAPPKKKSNSSSKKESARAKAKDSLKDVKKK